MFGEGINFLPYNNFIASHSAVTNIFTLSTSPLNEALLHLETRVLVQVHNFILSLLLLIRYLKQKPVKRERLHPITSELENKLFILLVQMLQTKIVTMSKSYHKLFFFLNYLRLSYPHHSYFQLFLFKSWSPFSSIVYLSCF